MTDALLQWSSDGRSIFLRGPEDSEVKIYRLDLQSGVKNSGRNWRRLAQRASSPSAPIPGRFASRRTANLMSTRTGQLSTNCFWLRV
jgi:hypothetical protein